MRKFLICAVLIFALVACGSTPPPSTQLLAARDVTAMHAVDSSTVRFALRNGEIWDSSSAGVRSAAPVSRLESGDAAGHGILGVTVDTSGRTFISQWQVDGTLVVADITSGIRLIWTGGSMKTNPGGGISVTPGGRILVGVGDGGRDPATVTPAVPAGQLITLDPDLGPGQLPNVISEGWIDPRALTYDQGGNLWVADRTPQNTFELGRAGPQRMVGRTTSLGQQMATGLVAYATSELAACLQPSGKVTRFLLQNFEAIPGRVLGTECSGPMAPLGNRVAYASVDGIRVTAG